MIKQSSDRYSFHFVQDDDFKSVLCDNQTGKTKSFIHPHAGYMDNIKEHFNSLTDVQMKDFLK